MGGGGCHRGHSGIKARGPITIPMGGGGKQRQGRWRGPLATQRGSRARFESAAHGLAHDDLLCGGCAPGNPLSYLARAAMGSAAQKGRVSRREQAVASYKLGGAEGGAQCRL